MLSRISFSFFFSFFPLPFSFLFSHSFFSPFLPLLFPYGYSIQCFIINYFPRTECPCLRACRGGFVQPNGVPDVSRPPGIQLVRVCHREPLGALGRLRRGHRDELSYGTLRAVLPFITLYQLFFQPGPRAVPPCGEHCSLGADGRLRPDEFRVPQATTTCSAVTPSTFAPRFFLFRAFNLV